MRLNSIIDDKFIFKCKVIKLKFLITGGLGFIGSSLIRKIIKETDHQVLNLDKQTYASNILNLKSIEPDERYTFIKGDICDEILIEKLLFDFQPDYLMHLAAESHVDNSINNPSEFIRTNIFGTFSLLKNCHQYWKSLPKKKKETFKFHHISTDEVYGSQISRKLFNENSRYDPSSPYDANSFRYGSITATNVSQVINSSTGEITLAAGSAIASGLSAVTGSLLVPIIDNASGTTVATKTITFSKSIKASRDGAIFTFEESTNSNISAANASDFAGSLSNAAAQAAATAVIAASIDGFLRPNDRVTITDNSANKAGTRIFTGTGTTSAASVAASDFSSLVVETFSGSVIVDGTLSADKLTANTTTTNTLNIGSNTFLL
mgnify:CR=1 FL=1